MGRRARGEAYAMNAWAVTAASFAVVGAVNILRPGRTHPHQQELAAAGWAEHRTRVAAVAVTGLVAVFAGAVCGTVFGWASSVPFVAAGVVWLPFVIPRLIQNGVLASIRPARDVAILSWLQLMRLYTASGAPVTAAAVEAAERTADKAFYTISHSIDQALQIGADPLAAAARSARGSAAETLLATITTVDQTGAGAAGLIDRILDRSIQLLNAADTARIDKTARTVTAATTLISVITGVLILTAVMLTLPTTI